MEDDVLKLKEVVSVTFDTTPFCHVRIFTYLSVAKRRQAKL